MDTDKEPSEGRRRWFSIFWGIAVICLWGFAIVGPFLFLIGVASFFTDVDGLEMFEQPVETFQDRLLFTGNTLFVAVIGLSYVLIWRKRAIQDARVMWAFMAVIYLGVPLMQVSMLAYYYKSHLDSAYFTTVEIRLYDAETGERIGMPVGASGPRVESRKLLHQHDVLFRVDGTMEMSVMDTRPVKVVVGAPGYISQDIEIGPDTREIDVRLQRAEDIASERNHPDR